MSKHSDDPIEEFDRAYPVGRNDEPPAEAERPIPERFALPALPPRDEARFELPDVPAPEPPKELSHTGSRAYPPSRGDAAGSV